MSNKKQKTAGDELGETFSEFGRAMSEIFNDPKLKSKAKDFSKSFADSAEIFVKKFKDEEVKNRFRKMGQAAQRFGKKMQQEGEKVVKKVKKSTKSKK
jgi:hypothetical protein